MHRCISIYVDVCKYYKSLSILHVQNLINHLMPNNFGMFQSIFKPQANIIPCFPKILLFPQWKSCVCTYPGLPRLFVLLCKYLRLQIGCRVSSGEPRAETGSRDTEQWSLKKAHKHPRTGRHQWLLVHAHHPVLAALSSSQVLTSTGFQSSKSTRCFFFPLKPR